MIRPDKDKAEALSVVFLFDKPAGITSHDAVEMFRAKLGVRKIGHGGTLDPMARGLLIIFVGRALKKQAFFQGLLKRYEGEITFGVETDTWDADGKIVSRGDVGISRFSLEKCVEFMSGAIVQMVPPFSAVKYRGMPLYKLARKNVSAPVIKRRVNVRWLDWEYDSPVLRFSVECSGGTYLRSLAHEMGGMLGPGAHLSALRRTMIGGWSVEDAFGEKLLARMSRKELLKRALDAAAIES